MRIIDLAIPSIFICVLVTACAGSNPSQTRKPPQKVYDLSLGFPDGSWTGSGSAQEMGKEAVRTEVALSISDNQFVTETEFADGVHRDAIDKFVYKSAGKADWIGLDDSKIGSCTCTKSQCSCTSELDGIAITRMIAFSKMGIRIEETSTAGGKTYTSACNLTPR